MNFVSFSILQCVGFLLTSAATATMDQSEPAPADTSKYDLSDIDESNIKYIADQALLSANAEAYFVGHRRSRTCYTLTGVIACQFSGPVKVLLVYKDDKKFVDRGAGGNGVCYTGRRGMFCDVQDDFDLKDVLKPPAGENSMAPGRGIYSIEIGPTKEYWRCMFGYQYELCTAIGPVHIDLTHDGLSSAFDIGESTHAFCYAGRLGSFCDVYEKAAADK